MDKVWKQTRFDNYMMSVDGEVFGIYKNKVLKQRKDKNGYPVVCIYDNGKQKMVKIHRLIWETFIGEIPDGYQIDHINTIRDDNRLENLRCVTAKENCNNPETLKHRTIANRKLANDEKWLSKNRESVRKSHGIPVIQIDKHTGETIREWECGVDAERELNISHVNQCCLGKRKSAGGFKWRYA